ncbi:hypothetical protein CH35J_006006 [Colletotrichum higginsianum]|uniref:Cyclase n=1 Tax=Colletotrichum higginsianum TaxID=80884 RepID=A0A4T0W3V7_9PEZI|nr:hypothetical protein CH35J_006006 [Colletotrichum higginsianum]
MAPPTPDFLLNENGIPTFDVLPLGRDDPRFSAWGLYGDNDELGTLNRLTDERVVAAARNEIRTGASRPPSSPAAPSNTTSSASTRASSTMTSRPSTRTWQKHGIIGRGILVDYHTWRLERQIPYDPFARDSIPVSDLKACLEAQGTEVKFGDILLTRTGFMTAHAGKSADDLETYRAAMPQTSGGVAQSEKTLRWVRDNSPAVGGDQPSFECWPHRDPEHWMHEVLLAGWGMPIGELFDLEALAERCRREGRWSFFVASKPCNIPGGVASPPNILAIF